MHMRVAYRFPWRGSLSLHPSIRTDLSLDGMEVWSETPPQPEPAAAAAAQDKGAVWAPLERYVKGEVAPLPLTSPVYTGISLHYR